MEAQDTKSITESSFNLLKQYLIDTAMIPLLKWLMLRQLPRPIKAGVKRMYVNLTNKYGSAVKAVESDGTTKEKDYIDNLTFEEAIEISQQMEKDGIPHYLVPKDEVPNEDEKGFFSKEGDSTYDANSGKLDRRSRMLAFKAEKAELDARKEHLDKLNKKGVTGWRLNRAEKNYNKALNSYNKKRKEYEGNRWQILTNKRHSNYNQERFDEIKAKRTDAYSVANSQIVNDIVEQARENSST